jgi:hypothetical protein
MIFTATAVNITHANERKFRSTRSSMEEWTTSFQLVNLNNFEMSG